MPTKNNLLTSKSVQSIACGHGFTFISTNQNEILVTGKLPFMICAPSSESDMKTDFVKTFQSVAQFDTRVKITQLNATRFASIVVDP